MNDEQRIRSAIDDFVKAFNARQFDQIEAILSDTVVDMSAGRETIAGPAAKQAFRKQVEGLFAGFDSRLEITVEEVRVAGDWAFDRGHLEVRLRSKQDSSVKFKRQRFLEIWRKQKDGAWRIQVIMDNDLP